jgi:hypothetical protein
MPGTTERGLLANRGRKTSADLALLPSRVKPFPCDLSVRISMTCQSIFILCFTRFPPIRGWSSVINSMRLIQLIYK